MNFETILKLPQEKLKNTLHHELKKLGYKPKNRKKYLYAEGTVPVLLIAHLDTVHLNTPQHICYSYLDTSPIFSDQSQPHILMSPQGIGGDDRCGVYMIMEVIKKVKCHVLFCEDEEIGGLGASAFTRSIIRPEVNYIIGLDRRGANDAVFYDCDNPEFTDFVTQFGFEEEMGSFSDISIVAPHLQIAAVNLSVGFYNEHTKYEYIDMNVVRTNIDRVIQMVNTEVTQPFEYIEALNKWHSSLYKYWNMDSLGTTTHKDLVFMPEDGYIETPDGFISGDELYDYMLDPENCDVYLYDYSQDTALLAKDYVAHGSSGLKPRLDKEYLIKVTILQED